MGSVWRVVDDGGNTYAMKILRDSLAEDADPQTRKAQITARERLRREAMALRKINAPGVCAIVDMEIDDALAFIVTELIEGKNLRQDVQANGKYVGDDLERLASKLIDAVQAVHDAGIVHRDIKPTNVMVSVTGPVLVDFGIAMGEGESHVTSTGLVMGTPGFIAPEIIEGTESNDATDWWSTASVLAFAATGEPVFGSSPMMAVLQREASGHANLQGLPSRTMQAFRSALSPRPQDRCTPQELLEAIRADAWSMPEVMPPFRPAASGAVLRRTDDVENPRLLWRAQSMPTTAVTLNPPPPPIPTAVLPQHSASAEEPVEYESTATLPALSPESSELPSDSAEQSSATQVLAQHATPALEVNGTRIMPRKSAAPVPDSAEPQTMMLEQNPVPESVPSQAASDAFENSAPEEFAAPQPVLDTALTTAQLRSRGRLALLLMTLPLACAAAVWPIATLLVAALLIWFTTTAGMNIAAQLQRVHKHQGKRGTDWLLRVASLPWHALKSLALSVPRIVGLWLISVLLAALGAWIMQLPVVWITDSWLSFTVQIPLIDDLPNSLAGLVLGGSVSVPWIVLVLWPRASLMQMGAGDWIGLTRAQAQQPNRRQFVWLALLIVLTMFCVLNVEIWRMIAWWPLPETPILT